MIFGLGAIFSAILGFPLVCYLIDPRHRQRPKSDFKPVDGIRLGELKAIPEEGVIRDTRMDGWTLHPDDVVGRVWVVKLGAPPADRLEMLTNEQVNDFNKDEVRKKAYLRVFTTVCPHLGCSVNRNAAGDGFVCPCHSASFALDGDRKNLASNPAGRGMDELEWEIDPGDPQRQRILVKYLAFHALKETKEPRV